MHGAAQVLALWAGLRPSRPWTDHVLRKLLPAGMDVPSSFETIGHVAHMNLRAHHRPIQPSPDPAPVLELFVLHSHSYTLLIPVVGIVREPSNIELCYFTTFAKKGQPDLAAPFALRLRIQTKKLRK